MSQVQNIEDVIKEIDNELRNLNIKFQNLVIEQENVRGKYTSLYMLRKKLTNTASNEEPEKVEEESIKELESNVESNVESKTETIKEEISNPPTEETTANKSSLSQEEYEMLQSLTNTQSLNKNVKEEDIPDYLKDEYKNSVG